jgi:hypothetical protein
MQQERPGQVLADAGKGGAVVHRRDSRRPAPVSVQQGVVITQEGLEGSACVCILLMHFSIITV